MTTDDRTCSRCGAPVPSQARFCPGCGSTVARLSPGQVLDGKYEILGVGLEFSDWPAVSERAEPARPRPAEKSRPDPLFFRVG